MTYVFDHGTQAKKKSLWSVLTGMEMQKENSFIDSSSTGILRYFLFV